MQPLSVRRPRVIETRPVVVAALASIVATPFVFGAAVLAAIAALCAAVGASLASGDGRVERRLLSVAAGLWVGPVLYMILWAITITFG